MRSERFVLCLHPMCHRADTPGQAYGYNFYTRSTSIADGLGHALVIDGELARLLKFHPSRVGCSPYMPSKRPCWIRYLISLRVVNVRKHSVRI